MFKLNIECTKDIDELHINFADGTSCIASGKSDKTPDKPTTKKSTTEKSSKPKPTKSKDDLLDLDTDFGGVSQDIVKPPEIKSHDREVKVAEELQNFDF
jgi:hypothetical protein